MRHRRRQHNGLDSVRPAGQSPNGPSVPIADWPGWWRHEDEPEGRKGDRLLITRIGGSSLLHVSGRAYWYGLGDDVHFGEVIGQGLAIGVYLHVVQSWREGSGCIIDLKYDPVNRTLDSYDNMGCGGVNVRFTGRWYRFEPK